MASHQTMFVVGQRVEFCDLVGAAHLNGRQGTIHAFDDAAGRFVVCADDDRPVHEDDQRMFRLKAENLKRQSHPSIRISEAATAALVARVLAPRNLISSGFAFVDSHHSTDSHGDGSVCAQHVVTQERLLHDLKVLLMSSRFNGRARVCALGDALGLMQRTSSFGPGLVVAGVLETAVRTLVSNHPGGTDTTFHLVESQSGGGSSFEDVHAMEVMSTDYLHSSFCAPKGLFAKQAEQHGGVVGVGALASAMGLPFAFVLNVLSEEDESENQKPPDAAAAAAAAAAAEAALPPASTHHQHPRVKIPGARLDAVKRVVVDVALEFACVHFLRDELLLACGVDQPSPSSTSLKTTTSGVSRPCALDAPLAHRVASHALLVGSPTTTSGADTIPAVGNDSSSRAAASAAVAGYFDASWCSETAQRLVDDDAHEENEQEGEEPGVCDAGMVARSLKGKGFLRSGGKEFIPFSYVDSLASRALTTLQLHSIIAFDSVLAQDLATLSEKRNDATACEQAASAAGGVGGKDRSVAGALRAAVEAEKLDAEDDVVILGQCAITRSCVSLLQRLVASSMRPLPLPCFPSSPRTQNRPAEHFSCPHVSAAATSVAKSADESGKKLDSDCVNSDDDEVTDCADSSSIGGDGAKSDDGNDNNDDENCSGGSGWVHVRSALAVAIATCGDSYANDDSNGLNMATQFGSWNEDTLFQADESGVAVETITAVRGGFFSSPTATSSLELASLVTSEELLRLTASAAVRSGALLPPLRSSLRRAAVVVSSLASLPPSSSLEGTLHSTRKQAAGSSVCSSSSLSSTVSKKKEDAAVNQKSASQPESPTFRASFQQVEALIAEALLLIGTTISSSGSGGTGRGHRRGPPSTSSSSSSSSFSFSLQNAVSALAWPPPGCALAMSDDFLVSRRFAAEALRVVAANILASSSWSSSLSSTSSATATGWQHFDSTAYAAPFNVKKGGKKKPAAIVEPRPKPEREVVRKSSKSLARSPTTLQEGGKLEHADKSANLLSGANEDEEKLFEEEEEEEEEWCIAGVGAHPGSLLSSTTSLQRSFSTTSSSSSTSTSSSNLKISAKEKRRVRQAGKKDASIVNRTKKGAGVGGSKKKKDAKAQSAGRIDSDETWNGDDNSCDDCDDDCKDDIAGEGGVTAPTVASLLALLLQWRPDLGAHHNNSSSRDNDHDGSTLHGSTSIDGDDGEHYHQHQQQALTGSVLVDRAATRPCVGRSLAIELLPLARAMHKCCVRPPPTDPLMPPSLTTQLLSHPSLLFGGGGGGSAMGIGCVQLEWRKRLETAFDRCYYLLRVHVRSCEALKQRLLFFTTCVSVDDDRKGGGCGGVGTSSPSSSSSSSSLLHAQAQKSAALLLARKVSNVVVGGYGSLCVELLLRLRFLAEAGVVLPLKHTAAHAELKPYQPSSSFSSLSQPLKQGTTPHGSVVLRNGRVLEAETAEQDDETFEGEAIGDVGRRSSTSILDNLLDAFSASKSESAEPQWRLHETQAATRPRRTSKAFRHIRLAGPLASLLQQVSCGQDYSFEEDDSGSDQRQQRLIDELLPADVKKVLEKAGQTCLLASSLCGTEGEEEQEEKEKEENEQQQQQQQPLWAGEFLSFLESECLDLCGQVPVSSSTSTSTSTSSGAEKKRDKAEAADSRKTWTNVVLSCPSPWEAAAESTVAVVAVDMHAAARASFIHGVALLRCAARLTWMNTAVQQQLGRGGSVKSGGGGSGGILLLPPPLCGSGLEGVKPLLGVLLLLTQQEEQQQQEQHDADITCSPHKPFVGLVTNLLKLYQTLRRVAAATSKVPSKTSSFDSQALPVLGGVAPASPAASGSGGIHVSDDDDVTGCSKRSAPAAALRVLEEMKGAVEAVRAGVSSRD